ncbi:MAG: NAD(P)(+) transhydrogenase (Re/Si-specific) subunit alpha, partial [Gammaproteobacteria bacterium]|nr:NAD(P)(+) transhydrogenase (Re/Si-specific) subunit alpha [Gammaproteobacteria bacterium]
RSAPRIVSRDMIESMRPRSVVVDMAVDSGGNVEGSELGKTIDINGVQLIGPRNLPSTVATHASQMLSSNLYEFIKHFKNDDEPILNLDPSDPIIERCLVTQGGKVLLDNGSES